jgi:hypothetical protein
MADVIALLFLIDERFFFTKFYSNITAADVYKKKKKKKGLSST